MNLQEIEEVNYFSVLKVPRNSNIGDIKRQFRKLSVESHPDKNPNDPTAEKRFMLLQKAHDILVNEERREAYDRFGELGLKWSEKSDSIIMMGAISSFVTLIMYCISTLVMTTLSNYGNSRFYAYTGLSFIFALTTLMKFNEFDIYVPFLPYATKAEKCDIFWRFYPSYLSACILIQSVMYVDVELLQTEMLKVILKQNEALLIKLSALNEKMNTSSLLKNKKK